MQQLTLFPLQDYWWFYIIFTLLIISILSIDLGVFHREAHEVSFKSAIVWSAIWVALALIFNYAFYQYALWKLDWDPRFKTIPGFDANVAATNAALEFLTGYIVELSLSVDNLFVFVVIFSYFAIPLKHQHRVLFYGILGALIFRGIFITIGAMIMQHQPLIILFGLFLVYTGIKVLFSVESDLNPEKNRILQFLSRHLPLTKTLHGQNFFITEGGKSYATPLFLTLVFVELSDIVFAVDSVPAIYAITREPMIVFCSNIFAILGLRSLYFLLASVVDRFHFLKYGLGLVLVFVGLKMAWLNDLYNGHFPIKISLVIIIGTIGTSILLSLIIPKKRDVP